MEASNELLVEALKNAFGIAGNLHNETQNPNYAKIKLAIKEATARIDTATAQEMAGLITTYSGGKVGDERKGSFVKTKEEIISFFQKKPKAAPVEEKTAPLADEGDGGEGSGDGKGGGEGKVTDIPALVKELRATNTTTHKLASEHKDSLLALAAFFGIEVSEKWNTIQLAAAVKKELEKE